MTAEPFPLLRDRRESCAQSLTLDDAVLGEVEKVLFLGLELREAPGNVSSGFFGERLLIPESFDDVVSHSVDKFRWDGKVAVLVLGRVLDLSHGYVR